MAETTSTIRLLPSDVVDQIAADEVVDRPAHLVKELVGNALDAGATQLEIEYDHGGRRVRVTDNGRGIRADELALALSRHATSKIVSGDDLWHLSTFGFRGEALASIGAVSRLTLQSRPADAEQAAQIRASFGQISPVETIGANPGTTVLVEELFANVPARLKFLKSDVGETSQIKAVLRALALAHEKVEFRLRTKGKLEHVWPRVESFVERAKQVLGTGKLYDATYDYEGFHAHAVFAGPHDVSGQSRSISIFVQGRWVQDRGLQAAVIDAYRGLLMHGEFPIVAVRLQAPTEEVDVNIHPTKSQVKFRDSQKAFRAVNRCLRAALEKAPWLTGATTAGSSADRVRAATGAYVQGRGGNPRDAQAPGRGTYAQGRSESQHRLSVADLTRPYETGSGKTDSATSESAAPSLANSPVNTMGRFEAPEFSTVQFQQKPSFAAAAEPAPVRGPTLEGDGELGSLSVPGSQAARAAGAWSRLQVLGQANLTYIVAQDAERLVLIDQHAAHERVAYERLMSAWLDGKIEVQAMLLPLTIELEGDGAEALLSVASDLAKLGVALDQLGPQSVAIRSKPGLIRDQALVQALTDLGREISERGGSFALEKKISDLCASMACHSVVRAGQPLSLEQMQSLLEQMDEFALSSFCPHGRPVSVDYPYSRLERDFGRIV